MNNLENDSSSGILLPFIGDLVLVRAKKVDMSLDEYAVWSAKNYIDVLLLRREPFSRKDLIEALLLEDFSENQADYGVFIAISGFGIHGNATGDLSLVLWQTEQ